jgi:hypothetical protein
MHPGLMHTMAHTDSFCIWRPLHLTKGWNVPSTTKARSSLHFGTWAKSVHRERTQPESCSKGHKLLWTASLNVLAIDAKILRLIQQMQKEGRNCSCGF